MTDNPAEEDERVGIVCTPAGLATRRDENAAVGTTAVAGFLPLAWWKSTSSSAASTQHPRNKDRC